MSRHRDVRNMDYSDDYDGYDDIYGHSVDDDYYISPSHRQFMYNREHSGQSRSGEVFPMEQDIQEEDESLEELKLSDGDKKKLESCLEYAKSTLAPLDMARQDIVKIIIENKFESDKILNSILNIQCTKPPERRDKDDTNLASNLLKQMQNNFISTSSNRISKNLQNFTKQTNEGSLDFVNTADPVNSDTVDSGSPLMRLSKFNECSSSSKVNTGPSITFLSKIKSKDSSGSQFYQSQMNSKNCLDTAFLGKIRTVSEEMSRNKATSFSQPPCSSNVENSATSNSLGISFISKIKRPPSLVLDSEGSSADSTPDDLSPQLSFLSKIKNLKALNDIESENTLDDFSNEFLHHLTLEKTNGRNKNSPAVNTFLNKININGTLGCLEQNKRDVKVTDIHSEGLADDMSRLKLMAAKSLPTFKEHMNRNDFKIDLTKALRKNNSEILKLKVKSSGDSFEIPFFACDDDLQTNNTDESILKCTLDISNIALKKYFFDKKRPSHVGKILCLRYRIPVSKKCKKKKLKIDPNLKRFDFSTPSPDDKIKKHLRRNF